MSNEWTEKASELRSALVDRAVAEYLKNHTQADIASLAGEGFAATPAKEQASIICTLAHELDTKLQAQNAI